MNVLSLGKKIFKSLTRGVSRIVLTIGKKIFKSQTFQSYLENTAPQSSGCL
jgi:hypothetical protein